MGSITAIFATVRRALVGSGIRPQTSQLKSAAAGLLAVGFMSQG